MKKKNTRTNGRLSGPAIGILLAIIFGLVIYVIATQLRAAPPQQKTPVTISTAEWSPYIGPELENNGPLAEIITDVLQRSGYQPHFEFTNWEPAEADVKNGATLAMGPVIDVDYRHEFGIYSDELMRFEYVLFGKTGGTFNELHKEQSLDGAKVAKIKGYKYWDALDDSGARFETFPTSLEAFKALARGEVDLVAEGKLAGQTVLRSEDFSYSADNFSILDNGHSFNSNARGLHLFFGASQESENIVQSVNETLKEYKDSAEYQSRIDEITNQKDYARLKAPDGSAVRMKLKGQDNSDEMVISNSQVIILDQPSLGAEPTVPVKVLNGPSAGLVGEVSINDVELDNG